MTIEDTIHAAAPDEVSVNIGLASLSPADLACFRDAGYLIHKVDLSAARSQHDLFRLVSGELDFPDIVTNLDALNDWLGDLEWFATTAGHVLVFTGLDILIGTLPEIVGTLCALCLSAANTMRRGDERFHVFLLGSSPELITRLAQAAATENESLAAAEAGPVPVLNHAVPATS